MSLFCCKAEMLDVVLQMLGKQGHTEAEVK